MDDQTLAQILSDLPEDPTAADYRGTALKILPYIQANVPPMGESQSIARLGFLTTVARKDLGLARLIEGHLDATQILREAGRPADSSKLYGIWASGGPVDTTDITEDDGSDGNAGLTGSKPFCSGSDIVDRALVYVYPAEQLVDVNMRGADSQQHLRFEAGQWKSSAFAETHTWTVRFEGLPVTDDDRIGGNTWYFDRPGFCLGALAPAACWAGGATGLVDSVRQRTPDNGHARAHLGAMVSSVCSMNAMLRWGRIRSMRIRTTHQEACFPPRCWYAIISNEPVPTLWIVSAALWAHAPSPLKPVTPAASLNSPFISDSATPNAIWRSWGIIWGSIRSIAQTGKFSGQPRAESSVKHAGYVVKLTGLSRTSGES